MSLRRRDIAAIRFGYGFDAQGDGPRSTAQLMQNISSADRAGGPVTTTNEALTLLARFKDTQRKIRDGEMGQEDKRAVLDIIHARTHGLFAAVIARGVSNQQPFRERLVQFWVDHFTVAMRGQPLSIFVPAYQEDAIRPHVTGSFADLLKAAVLHPAMLLFLDNHQSIGPNSRIGKRTGRGLNENLARELLELHTVGPQGGYSQSDVRELAELLTGLRVFGDGTTFQHQSAEPGPETILGQSYGGAERARLSEVVTFLDDIAVHPRTADYIAWKLARHFTSDTPDAALVAALAAEFLRTRGDLNAVYAVLLDHKASWDSFGQKVKRPTEFLISTLRALGVTSDNVLDLDNRAIRRQIIGPLQLMGQPMMRPNGPDGWPEEAEAWITATGLAGRVQWVADVTRKLGRDSDPRDQLERVLGPVAGGALRWAVPKAANRAEGHALILASPEFNRR